MTLDRFIASLRWPSGSWKPTAAAEIEGALRYDRIGHEMPAADRERLIRLQREIAKAGAGR